MVTDRFRIRMPANYRRVFLSASEDDGRNEFGASVAVTLPFGK